MSEWAPSNAPCVVYDLSKLSGVTVDNFPKFNVLNTNGVDNPSFGLNICTAVLSDDGNTFISK